MSFAEVRSSFSRAGRNRVKGRLGPGGAATGQVPMTLAAAAALTGTVLILTARANVVGFWILAVTRTPSTQSGTRAVSLGAAW